MAGLKDYQISVYVANLGKYVEGVLQGAWITLPMPAERLQDTLKTEVGLGGRYEEYAIHDYEGGEGLLATVANPGESFPYEANDFWTYRLSGQALRGALDLAVGWADPQETSPETAGLDLALDDGMETAHGR